MNVIDYLKYEMLLRSKIESPNKRWVFVVGCYNSGTTLLSTILSTYSQIASLPGEGQTLTKVFPSPKEIGLARAWALKPEIFRLDENSGNAKLARDFRKDLSIHYNDLNRPFLLEKSITNTARIRWLNKYFSNPYFIGIVRNGYAVSEGIRRKAGLELSKAAEQWAVSNQIMTEDLHHVENKIMISYEELADTPMKSVSKIEKFLGIKDGITDIVANRLWRVHGNTMRILNMNVDSISRLSESELDIIYEKSSEVMDLYGYIKPEQA